MDFREIAEALHGATVESPSIDLSAGRVEFALAPASSVIFDGLLAFKWSGVAEQDSAMTLSVVGLERLGAGESWRLYIRTANGAELELSCADVRCDGADVSGIGRSYRH